MCAPMLAQCSFLVFGCVPVYYSVHIVIQMMDTMITSPVLLSNSFPLQFGQQ